jgi:hypothetical protein
MMFFSRLPGTGIVVIWRMRSVSERSWKFALGLVVACMAGPAAAQDFTAGKTSAQLFQSDCSACHKSPQGLAKGMDQRSLASFLREHYTTKEETAGALAAYVSGAGPGDARQKPQAAGPAGPKSKPDPRSEPKPAVDEGEPSPKPAARSRIVAAPAAEPAQPPDGEGDSSIMREDAPRHGARATLHDGAKPAAANAVDPIVSKLKLYGNAGGAAKDTERLADPHKKLESYVNSGTPVPAVAPETPKDIPVPPTEAGGDNAGAAPAADDANPPPKRKGADKKRDAATAGSAGDPAAGTSAPHAPRPQRRAPPLVQPVPGNN